MELEAILFACVVAVTLLPLVAVVCRGRDRVASTVVVIAWLSVSAALAYAASSYRKPSKREQLVTDRPIEVPANGYVTSRACRACHPHQYSTWYASYHRTMTQVVTPETALGDFDGVELNATSRTEYGRTYHLQRRDNKLWVEIESPRHNDQFSDSDLLPMGDEPQRDQRRVAANGSLTRDRRRVVMSTGSHHHQAYWFTTGKTRELELLPFVYRVQEQKWIPRDAAFLKPPDRPWPTEMGRWSSMCVNCHATNGRPRVHAQHEVDTHVSEFGIACEACHGPGELHVRANRNPARRYRHHRAGTPDPTIV